MDIRSREAALKRRNDELDACQTLYGDEENTATPSYMQEQHFDTPLLSRQESVQDGNISSSIHVEQINGARIAPVRHIILTLIILTSLKLK